MNVYIFAVLCALQAVTKASNPYYYVPPQFQYQIPAPAPQIQYPTFNTFGNPFTRTSTYFGNQHFQYQSFIPQVPQIPHIPQIPQIPQYQQQQYQAPPPAEAQPPQDYQGFAYHTRNDNGATSHVLFVSGPQSQTLRSTLFPVLKQQTVKPAETAKNHASNLVDSVNTETEKPYPKSIQEIYTAPPAPTTPTTSTSSEAGPIQDPGQFFRSFFQRSEPSVVNFFSRNSNLFVRPVPGYAASTFPLANPLSSPSDDSPQAKTENLQRFYSPFINPRFNEETTEEVTTTTELNSNSDDKKSENVAAESVITNTRFRINEIIEQVEKLTSQATSTMAPIVVEDAASTMKPIIVEETTITTTSATGTTEEVKESSSEQEDLMKSLISFLTQETKDLRGVSEGPKSTTEVSEKVELVSEKAELVSEEAKTTSLIPEETTTVLATTESTEKVTEASEKTTVTEVSETTTKAVDVSEEAKTTSEDTTSSEEIKDVTTEEAATTTESITQTTTTTN